VDGLHLLVHRGGTPLDEGVLSWPVCQLSSSGYEPSAIGKNLHFFFQSPGSPNGQISLLGAKHTDPLKKAS